MTTYKVLHSPADTALMFIFIREASQNRGLMVEAIQRWSGGIPGQSWCAYFVLFILDIAFGGKDRNPIERSGAVQVIYKQAQVNGWITKNPVRDDLFIYVDDKNHAHHIGIVTQDGGRMGVAGNTSADGTSSNGDRVADHELITNPKHIMFIHYPR